MEELVNQTADPHESVPNRNRGWFQRGDARINREGRPRGAAWDRAPRADHLKRLVLRGRDVLFRLTNHDAPWIINLPRDTQIVDCLWNAAEEVVVLVLRSAEFPKSDRGALIPEFRPTV